MWRPTLSMNALPAAAVWWLYAGLVAVLPIFLIPLSWATTLQSKLLFVSIALILVSIAWAIRVIQEGEVRLPRSYALAGAALLPAAYIISASVHGGATSFVGGGAELDTVVAIFLLYALFVFSALIPGERDSGARPILTALAASATAVFVIEVARFILPTQLTLAIFSERTSTIVGSWHDLGVFVGLFVLVAVIGWETISLRTRHRWSLAASGVLAFALLVIITWPDVWYVLAGIAGAVFVVRGIVAGNSGRMLLFIKRSGHIGAFALIALALGYGSSFTAAHIPAALHVAQVEVRPSLQGTLAISGQALSGSAFVFGTGPNTFSDVWARFKPRSVNQTLFWDTDFESGFGAVPTSFVTAGALGLLAWAVIAALYVWYAARSMRSPDLGGGFALPLAAASGYLLVFQVVSAPGAVPTALAFVMLGLLVGVSSRGPDLRIALSLEEWKGAGALALVLAFVGCCAYFSLTSARAIISDLFVNKAVAVYGAEQDAGAALKMVREALVIYPENDRAERAALELGLFQLRDMIARGDTSDAGRAQLQAALSITVQHGLAAISIDNKNYQNWLALAAFYQQLVGAGVEGALEGARKAYEQALSVNPSNPLPLVSLAQLSVLDGKDDEALAFLDRALALKSDLPSALYLRSQLYAKKGDLGLARVDAQSVTSLASEDPLGWYNLGSVLYASSAYQEAVDALGRAVALQQDFANAYFVQALALDKLGRHDEAVRALERVVALNPEDPLLAGKLEDLKKGRPIDILPR